MLLYALSFCMVMWCLDCVYVKEDFCNEKFNWVLMLGGWLAEMVCEEAYDV